MDESTKPEHDYKIGFGRPPKHSQFKKGQSGNPKGPPRKKGSGGVNIADILNRTTTVRNKGRKQQMQPFEIAIRKQLKKALAGDVAAMIAFIKKCEQHGLINAPALSTGGVVTAPPGVDFQQWFSEATEPIPEDER